MAGTDVGLGLRNDLCPLHRLAIPKRGSVDCSLQTLCFARVRWVLVAGINSKIFRCRATAVNIPLPRLNLVRPTPCENKVSPDKHLVEARRPLTLVKCGGGEARVEESVPQHGGLDRRSERSSNSDGLHADVVRRMRGETQRTDTAPVFASVYITNFGPSVLETRGLYRRMRLLAQAVVMCRHETRAYIPAGRACSHVQSSVNEDRPDAFAMAVADRQGDR